jgi:hypothetical protein
LFWQIPDALILSLKRRIKHSAWLYMLRFIATFLTNWYITPWQHSTSINWNKLWNIVWTHIAYFTEKVATIGHYNLVSIPHFCRNSLFWTILVKICSLRCTANWELKIKHSAWLYMLRFIATFLTNWYITPWQHNTSINRNKLWNSYLVCVIRHCSPACLVHNFRCQWYPFGWPMTKSCALLNFDRLYVTSYDAIWKKGGKQIWVSM